jgi:biopolymer transport protein ExbD
MDEKKTEADEGEDFVPKKRKPPDTDVDITPMIDMTFQLLIFFMVTSTMQGTPDLDIPKSVSGGSIEVARVINVMLKAPADANTDPPIEMDGELVSLSELKTRVSDQAGARPKGIDIMLLADRSVPNGFMGEVEALLGEIPNVSYHFAVQDRRK